MSGPGIYPRLDMDDNAADYGRSTEDCKTESRGGAHFTLKLRTAVMNGTFERHHIVLGQSDTSPKTLRRLAPPKFETVSSSTLQKAPGAVKIGLKCPHVENASLQPLRSSRHDAH